jgi:hypothetical protein
VAAVQFEVLSLHLHGETEKNLKNARQDSQFPVQEYERWAPEFKKELTIIQ